MADTRALLNGLESYHEALQRHQSGLQLSFGELSLHWQVCSAAWEGDGAEQFSMHWRTTMERFDFYLERGRAIAALLSESIDALRLLNEEQGEM